MARLKWVLAVLVAIAIVAAIVTVRGGLSARDEPTRAEVLVARLVRHWAIPASLRDAKNPVAPAPTVMADARAHFADHCASCHGNDGKGAGIGNQMYPRAPDMTLPATQSLSDGELFAIIENGVRLTGMPGFGNGTAESATSSWGLVHFIRHLPRVTPEELAEMEKMNPKSPEQWRQMQEEEEFLKGN